MKLPPYLTREAFIARLEHAHEDGDADFIEANMPALEKLIADLQDASYELAVLQRRARDIRESHEPSAHQRLKQAGRG